MASSVSPEQRARELYQRTDYQQSLSVLLPLSEKSPQALQLIGQDYFMLGEYKKATEALEKAAAADPKNAWVFVWLGRAYGRRAEMASPFTAPGYAGKARQNLERAVQLDPSNREAAGDLLDFYLDAPGFLGGGLQKAEQLAKQIGETDPAEQHYAQAIIDQRKKDFQGAEQQFRRAVQLAPHEVGRFVALAKYLAKQGNIQESDALFEQARRMEPNNPQVLFDRAQTYVEQRRNLSEARQMLEQYLKAPLTPNDPPRERAEALLKKIT
jgi:Flp pilus assembly protein TadD